VSKQEFICDVLQKGGRDASNNTRGTYVLTPKENESFERYYKVFGEYELPV